MRRTRPVLRSCHGPKMNLSSVDGAAFGHLHERGEYAYTVRDLKGRPLLRIDLLSGAAFGRPLFRPADGRGRRIGEVQTQGRMFRTRLLHVRIEGRMLRLTRNAPMGRTGSCRTTRTNGPVVRRSPAVRGGLDRRTGAEQGG